MSLFNAQILNTAGLVCGLVGAALVWKYGIPAIDVLSRGSYVGVQATPEMRAYSVRSRWGLGLIGFGFLLQLIAVWL